MKDLPFPRNVNSTNINDQYVYISDMGRKSYNQTGVHYHIFMITGNPGCIAYYHEFLSLLWVELQSKRANANVNVSIYGASMSGFTSTSPGAILGLQGQIQYLEACLNSYIERHVIAASGVEHKVIIVGHSVGAYIGLEVIRRFQDDIEKGRRRGFQMLGFIGLWPTVTHIVKSKRGQNFGWLLKLPFFAFLVSLLARMLLFILGQSLVITILKLAKFPEDAARVTVKFLASRKGVYQALYMAGDEMREITADRWSEDIWGAALLGSGKRPPKIVMCFGKDDHWVADQHRDELIQTRGRYPGGDDWRAEMVVDETGIPHSFCINHSSAVSKKTVRWIEEMFD